MPSGRAANPPARFLLRSRPNSDSPKSKGQSGEEAAMKSSGGFLSEVCLRPLRFVTSRGLVLAAASLFAASPAQAVLLGPNQTLPLPGTTVAAEPQLAGLIIVDEIIPFSFASISDAGTILGTVQQR